LENLTLVGGRQDEALRVELTGLDMDYPVIDHPADVILTMDGGDLWDPRIRTDGDLVIDKEAGNITVMGDSILSSGGDLRVSAQEIYVSSNDNGYGVHAGGAMTLSGTDSVMVMSGAGFSVNGDLVITGGDITLQQNVDLWDETTGTGCDVTLTGDSIQLSESGSSQAFDIDAAGIRAEASGEIFSTGHFYAHDGALTLDAGGRIVARGGVFADTTDILVDSNKTVYIPTVSAPVGVVSIRGREGIQAERMTGLAFELDSIGWIYDYDHMEYDDPGSGAIHLDFTGEDRDVLLKNLGSASSVRLADAAGTLEHPELAAERWTGLLRTAGVVGTLTTAGGAR
jgi:hypothetical protein